MSKRYGREQWVRWVDAWKLSGKRAPEFAAEIGVAQSSLWRWALALRPESRGGEPRVGKRRDKPARAAATAFVELVPKASASASVIEIRLASGHRVAVDAGFDDSTLLRVVTLLGGR